MRPSRNAIAGMALTVGDTPNTGGVFDPSIVIEPNSTRTARKMAIRETTKKGFRMLSSIGQFASPAPHSDDSLYSFERSDLQRAAGLVSAANVVPGLLYALWLRHLNILPM